MKTRSEMLKMRSEGSKPKTSAAERTIPLPLPEDSRKIICEGCDAEQLVSELKDRGDGHLECKECGMAIRAKDAVRVAKHSTDVSSQPDTKIPNGFPATGKMFCSVCATEWPYMNGKPYINCGHMHAKPVDDPLKAEQIKPPAGHGTPRVSSPSSTPVIHSRIVGTRLLVTWEKSRHPVDQFNHFYVGPFHIEEELTPGTNRVEAAEAILTDLQAIADIAYKMQSMWYAKKLGNSSK